MTTLTTRRRPSAATVSVAVLLAVYAALGLLAHHVHAGTTLDHAVLDAMVRHRSPGLTAWALAVTTAFSPVGVGVLAVAAAAALWWRLGSPGPAILVLAALALAFAASSLTKVIVGAHRPPAFVQLVTETDPSFPSGHVTGTMAVLGALTAVIGHHSRRATRALLIAATLLAGVAVAFSRLYLGVHWASDVLGGLLLGATAALLTHLVYQRLRQPSGVDGQGGPSSTTNPVPAALTRPS